MKVLVYGSINIDLVFSVEHIVRPGETVASRHFERKAGGKGANQAVALSRAGSDVWFAGKSGPDAQWIVDLMQKSGVNTDLLCRTDSPNGQAVIQVEHKAQNAIILMPGSNAKITTEEIDAVLEHFGADDCLVLQNEIPHIAYLIEKAWEKDMFVVFNPSPLPDFSALPLDKVDLFVLNEIEAAAMAGMDSDADYEAVLDALAAAWPQTEFVLTAGSAGAFYRMGDISAYSSSPKVKAVDTTGAGDTFLGYFLTLKNEMRPVEDCLCDACLAASIACTRKGAMPSIPERREIDGD